MLDQAPLIDLLKEQGVNLALDILVRGLAATCLFLTLTFVATAVIGAVAEFKRVDTLPRLPTDEFL